MNPRIIKFTVLATLKAGKEINPDLVTVIGKVNQQPVFNKAAETVLLVNARHHPEGCELDFAYDEDGFNNWLNPAFQRRQHFTSDGFVFKSIDWAELIEM
jgi:hypothetical protein